MQQYTVYKPEKKDSKVIITEPVHQEEPSPSQGRGRGSRRRHETAPAPQVRHASHAVQSSTQQFRPRSIWLFKRTGGLAVTTKAEIETARSEFSNRELRASCPDTKSIPSWSHDDEGHLYCLICCELLVHCSVGKCGHRNICHMCAVRQRELFNDKKCCLCKACTVTVVMMMRWSWRM